MAMLPCTGMVMCRSVAEFCVHVYMWCAQLPVARRVARECCPWKRKYAVMHNPWFCHPGVLGGGRFSPDDLPELRSFPTGAHPRRGGPSKSIGTISRLYATFARPPHGGCAPGLL